jgi:hypothetical protein
MNQAADSTDLHWIIVFGRPGCGFTEKGVKTLLKNGRYPFVYISLPDKETREKFWDRVQDFAKGVVLERTFPSIVVWDPDPTLFDSQTIGNYLSSHAAHDTGSFQNTFVQSRAENGDVMQNVRRGRNFVWNPTFSSRYLREFR